MPPHTNQVVPVEPTEEFDFRTMDAQQWANAFCKQFPGPDPDLMIAWFANAIMAGYDTAQQRAAAPQQQGEPVTSEWQPKFYGYNEEKCGCQYALYKLQVTDCGGEWDPSNPPKLYTQPLTADASFNQGVEAAAKVCDGKRESGEYFAQEIRALKCPTDMVTITRDELEEIVFGCVLKGYNYRAETPMSRRIEHWEADLRAIVSRALEGK